MSLAVAEERPQQRNAGCVGVFFQLFSKKKLFSNRKLLPAAKNFAADDKMPMAKLLLIADENREEYPELESEPDPDLENRMHAPGLLARLMGLESMPIVHSDKPRKALDSNFSGDTSDEHCRLDQGLCVDSGGNGKGELRPQKLQKTGRGFLERQPVEGFQKGLVYGVKKKKQYMKFETPVKSPKLGSRSSASRLVQVANRILEPGLQSRSRAITYRGGFRDDRENDGEILRCGMSVKAYRCGLQDARESDGEIMRCERSVRVEESLVVECRSSGSDLSTGSEGGKNMKSLVVVSSGSRRNGSLALQSKVKPEEGNNKKAPVVSDRQIMNRSLAIEAKLNLEIKACDLMMKKKHLGNVSDQYEHSVIRRNNLRKNKLSAVRDEMILTRKKQKECINAKNFVSLNKNLNNYTRSRSPTKVRDSRRVESERDGWKKKNLTQRSSTERNTETSSSNIVSERCIGGNVVSRKGTGITDNQSPNRRCTKNTLPKMDHDSCIVSDNNGIVSFTFNSPIKRDSRPTNGVEKVQERRGEGELNHDDYYPKKLTSNVKIGSSPSEKGIALNGDGLSSLLEEKIRELSSVNDQYELASGNDLQGRSTVSILEELISALTAGTPELNRNGSCCSDVSIQTENSISNNEAKIDEDFQEKAQPGTGSTDNFLAGVNEQPSPVSILDASFSNDSCSVGSSNEENSGNKTQLWLPEICDNTQSSGMDSDLFDSASSANLSQSLNKTMNTYEVGASEADLNTACESISDAELLFEKISLCGSDKTLVSSFDTFLLDALESISDVFSVDSKLAKEGNQLREFLYDCIMECLDSKFRHFSRSGYRTWLKLPSILNRDCMMRDVHLEISGWNAVTGKALDDLPKRELKGSNARWTECEIEAFEAGIEIQSDILQELINEMVIELN